MSRILVFGYGNPGRLDDGLGPALARILETRQLPDVTVDANYQLSVEDAALVAAHDCVLFADAAVAGPEPFWVKRILPYRGPVSYSSHSVDPRAVLALAQELFAAEPAAFLMGIRGYQFDQFGERLSEQAQTNLQQAVQYVEQAVCQGNFREIHREQADLVAPDPKPEGDESCKMESM